MTDNKMTAEQALEQAYHKFELCGATTEWEVIRQALSATRVLDPIEGDQLPPVGSKVLIHLGREDEWVEHTVVGYYAWPDLNANPNLHRVFVRVRSDSGSLNVRMLKDVRHIDDLRAELAEAKRRVADLEAAPVGRTVIARAVELIEDARRRAPPKDRDTSDFWSALADKLMLMTETAPLEQNSNEALRAEVEALKAKQETTKADALEEWATEIEHAIGTESTDKFLERVAGYARTYAAYLRERSSR